MCKRNVWLLTGLLSIALLLAVSCQAQDRGLRNRPPGTGVAAQLLDDINVLQRLVPLKLTDEQLAAVLQVYENQPAEPEAESVQKMREMKQRLVGGTALVSSDLAILRGLAQRALGVRRGEVQAGEPAVERLTPLGQSIWDLLTMQQKASLLGEVSGPAADNQRAGRQVALRAVRAIGSWRGLDPAQWTAARDFVAKALAAPAGTPDTDAYRNAVRLYTEFLDRIKAMPDTDFARGQDELTAELQALVPLSGHLTVALAECTPRQIVGAMAVSFLAPTAPRLLKEIQAARAQ